jgi:penicillin-binding protein 2
MARRETFKNPYQERKLFVVRAMVAAFGVFLLLGVLAARMAYLQLASHDLFKTLSQENRVKVVAVPPPRGLIYDRNGVVLAENLPSYRLEITPSQVIDLEQTLSRLSQFMPIDESDLTRFRAEMQRREPFQPVALLFNLSDEEVADFAVNRHRFPGVDIVAHSSRRYPTQNLAAHAVGYVGRINEREQAVLDPNDYNGTSHIGKLGVESHYEELLHGAVGFQHVEINAQGRPLRVLDQTPPVPGSDLVLSLDSGLQRIAEAALGDANGAVVAVEPATGEVLALVSKPAYNPNLFVDGISHKDYGLLRDDPDRPLFDRSLSGQYPPGSTIKPFMALAGLEYGVTEASRTMWAGPYYQLPGDSRRYRDWKPEGHGTVNMALAIMRSADVYFYDLAHRLGIDRMHDFLVRFGFGEVTGIDSTGEARGLMPSSAWKRAARGQVWFPGETLSAGIGQGYMLTTPLQLAVATGTLAMRGRRVQPRLLHATRDPDTTSFKPVEGKALGAVQLNQAVFWDQVIGPMVDVTRNPRGTAYHVGHDAPYTIAGKTGTAQVFGLAQNEKYDAEKIAEKLRDHALFIAFAPAEAPRIAVAVVVENGGGGGRVAAPVARQVMDYWLLGSEPPLMAGHGDPDAAPAGAGSSHPGAAASHPQAGIDAVLPASGSGLHRQDREVPRAADEPRT